MEMDFVVVRVSLVGYFSRAVENQALRCISVAFSCAHFLIGSIRSMMLMQWQLQHAAVMTPTTTSDNNKRNQNRSNGKCISNIHNFNVILDVIVAFTSKWIYCVTRNWNDPDNCKCSQSERANEIQYTKIEWLNIYLIIFYLSFIVFHLFPLASSPRCFPRMLLLWLWPMPFDTFQIDFHRESR